MSAATRGAARALAFAQARHDVVKAAYAWREHYERGKRPSGSMAELQRWSDEKDPVAQALIAALDRLARMERDA